MLGKINRVIEQIRWGPISGPLLGKQNKTKQCFYEVTINTLKISLIKYAKDGNIVHRFCMYKETEFVSGITKIKHSVSDYFLHSNSGIVTCFTVSVTRQP